MYCTHCGKQRPDEAAFCPFCGAPKAPERQEPPAVSQIPTTIPVSCEPELNSTALAPIQPPEAPAAAPVIQAAPAHVTCTPPAATPAEPSPGMKTGLFVVITVAGALGALLLGICAGAGIGSIF